MMLRVVPFEPWHAKTIKEQPGQEHWRGFLTDAHLQNLAAMPHSRTILNEDEVLLCGGVVQYWPNRAEAWVFLAADCGHLFLSLHKHVLKFFKECPQKRIEATVDYEFEKGHRWMQLLGFKREAERLHGYRIDGGDSSLYAMVRG